MSQNSYQQWSRVQLFVIKTMHSIDKTVSFLSFNKFYASNTHEVYKLLELIQCGVIKEELSFWLRSYYPVVKNTMIDFKLVKQIRHRY